MSKIPIVIKKNDSCVLDNKICLEKIDVKILDALIDSDLLKKTFNNPMSGVYFENEKEQLKAYRKLIDKNGFAMVKYEKVKGMEGWGRCNPKKSLGLFSIRREIRQTLAKNVFCDLDIKNAHPSLLYQIAKSNKICCSNLENYVKNRQSYYDEITNTYDVDEEKAKKLFISLLYLGGIQKWLLDNKLDEKIKIPTSILKLKTELKKIAEKITEKYDDLKKLIEKSKKNKKTTHYHEEASTISYILQEWECQILESIYLYIIDKNIIENKNEIVFCADGLMFYEKYYKPELLNEFSEHIKEKFGFDLIFTKKEMTQDYCAEINKIIKENENKKIDEENKQRIEAQIIKDGNIKQTNDSYLKIKTEIEKYHFFIQDIAKFGYYNKEDNKFIIKTSQSLELCLAPYQYDIYTTKSIIKAPFYDTWIKDITRRSYDSIIFDPSADNKNNKNFNLFTGFELENKEYVKKDTKNIHKVLDHVLGEYKKYVLEWFGFILKYKKKTNIFVLLYSDAHGVGKNSVIELFLKLIDSKYSSKIENIDEITSSFNGFLESKMFVYGDEIIAKNKEVYNMLKNIITRTEVKINKKGVEGYKIQDLSNFMGTTNEHFPFKAEKGDRRLSMIQCNEKKLPDEDYKFFYNDLKDNDILCSFFNEIIGMEIPEKMIALETEMKSDIQDVFTPSPIKFLYQNYKTLEGKKYTVNELFTEIKDFEKSLGYTETKTTKYMAMKLNSVAEFSKKSNGKRGYHFLNLAKKLEEYDPVKFEEY